MFGQLFIVGIFLLTCLILAMQHCYLKRGLKLTFSFYFFSFLYITRWVLRNIDDTPSVLKTARQLNTDRLFMTFDPLPSAVSAFIFVAVVILGWMFLSYIGWYLAEKIMQRFYIFQNRLFPTLLLSAVIMVSFLYPIEVIGSNLGWWRWKISHMPYDVFFMGYSVHPLREWFYFTLYFLAAYLLIEYSKFKHSDWKMAFFILPFIHVWAIRFFGNGIPRVLERLGFITIVVVLTFLSALKLEGGRSDEVPQLKNTERGLSISIILMLFFLYLVDILIINKPLLGFSILPALFLYFFSIRNIGFFLILLFGCLILFISNILAAPLLVPLSILALFKISDYSERGSLK